MFWGLIGGFFKGFFVCIWVVLLSWCGIVDMFVLVGDWWGVVVMDFWWVVVLYKGVGRMFGKVCRVLFFIEVKRCIVIMNFVVIRVFFCLVLESCYIFFRVLFGRFDFLKIVCVCFFESMLFDRGCCLNRFVYWVVFFGVRGGIWIVLFVFCVCIGVVGGGDLMGMGVGVIEMLLNWGSGLGWSVILIVGLWLVWVCLISFRMILKLVGVRKLWFFLLVIC